MNREIELGLSRNQIAGLLGCGLKAASSKGSLFHTAILSSHSLERSAFADFT